ncbi:hypothetical protein B0T19DRAFT_353421 [Cercophora scortea]|uniref:Protein BNI4 n=1 Tax=Cercophora scortea TaxID=314031 RepID=A0AAE0MI64_9PEZI|nr:hypothetical protein B0T19DRAFT_353421 [Cercophora scortea]
MAALVQGYPRQSGTVTMLQTRPTSASGIMSSQNHPSHQQYGHGLPQQRNSIHGLPSGAGAPVAYRGNSGPVQPYAFTATPSLNPAAQWQQFRTTYRTTSTPAVPGVQSFDYGQPSAGRPRYSASVSMTNLPSTAIIPSQTGGGSRDDSMLSVSSSRRTAAAPRPQSAHITTESFSQAGLPASAGPTRVSPERYRRPAPRAPESAVSSLQSHGPVSPQPSGAGIPAGGMPSGSRGPPDQTLRPAQTSLANRPNSVAGPMSGSAVDDIELSRAPTQDGMQRFRRRSMPALDSAGFSKPLTPPAVEQPEESSRLDQAAPRKLTDSENKAVRTNNNLAVDRGIAPAHARAGSSDSRSSSRSAGSSSTRPTSSANRNANPTGNPAAQSSTQDQTGNSADYPRLVNIPPRSSSSDAASTKRVTNPSPLSKPAAMDAEVGNRLSADAPANTPASPMKTSEARIESPAVRQLAAINQTGGKARSKTSRLRRAFSFGSAAEFRKVVHNDSDAREDTDASVPAKLHKERNAEELYHAEQARIAQQQEEAGIGNNIYSGGKIFSGSTDNISISSTASSASIMIRKMGRGMKKGTRSLVGLFRPKSIIGAPAADSQLPEATQGSVSMVTVEAEREAERERVNVNSDVRSQPGGGTGFPHLERNSIDATDAIAASKASSAGSDRLDSSGTDTARKSIVGGERERAEVLAAVRKGILKKRSGSSSPSPRPSESKPPAFDPSSVPNLTDSPNSSAPSTPNEETQGHRRTGPVAIGNEDYFISALRLRQDTKSAPSTPQGSMRRNATFSPRIAFYETWPSQEYDRRGDVATCNRLTPMLAQQIKEELNSFKMEMEVHENSKIYTHFF